MNGSVWTCRLLYESFTYTGMNILPIKLPLWSHFDKCDHSGRYFTFNYHVSELCRKAARQVNCLMRLSTMLPVESKLRIFNAFIVSNFLYCPVVWHMCSKSDTKKVE